MLPEPTRLQKIALSKASAFEKALPHKKFTIINEFAEELAEQDEKADFESESGFSTESDAEIGQPTRSPIDDMAAKIQLMKSLSDNSKKAGTQFPHAPEHADDTEQKEKQELIEEVGQVTQRISLRMTSGVSKVLDEAGPLPHIRGVYVNSGVKSYGGIYYDSFRDVTGQQTLTLIVTESQRKELKSSGRYVISAYAEAAPDRGAVNSVQVVFRLISYKAETEEDSPTVISGKQIFDIALEERKCLSNKKESAVRIQTIETRLKQLTKEHAGGGQGTIKTYVVCGRGNAVMDDIRKNISPSGSSFFDFQERQVALSPDNICREIDKIRGMVTDGAPMPIVIFARGGGASIDLNRQFDARGLAMKVASIDWALTIDAIGHTRDEVMIDAASDVSRNTPTAVASWLDGLVEKAQKETAEDDENMELRSKVDNLSKQTAALFAQLETERRSKNEIVKAAADKTLAEASASTIKTLSEKEQKITELSAELKSFQEIKGSLEKDIAAKTGECETLRTQAANFSASVQTLTEQNKKETERVEELKTQIDKLSREKPVGETSNVKLIVGFAFIYLASIAAAIYFF